MAKSPKTKPKMGEKVYTKQKSAPCGLKAAESLMSLASVGSSLTGLNFNGELYKCRKVFEKMCGFKVLIF